MSTLTRNDQVMLQRFQAVAEATRLRIVQLLTGGERCVCELQEDLSAAQSRLSFHLKKLKEAGVVSARRGRGMADRRLLPAGVVSNRYEADMSADVKNVVREKYGKAALTVLDGKQGCCCGSGDPITRDLYDSVTASSLPEEAVLASLGRGNPTALAELNAGEVVLDPGSGGGSTCSCRRSGWARQAGRMVWT